MPISLYDAVVPSNLQILGAIDALLDKAEAFCGEKGMAAADLIDARLAPDMLPFGYQVKSCAAHSVGGIEGVRAGSFSPDMTPWPTDFAGLQAAGYYRSGFQHRKHNHLGPGWAMVGAQQYPPNRPSLVMPAGGYAGTVGAGGQRRSIGPGIRLKELLAGAASGY